MTSIQKLILFLISCDPGVKDIKKMITIYDRADFACEIGKNLKPLLDNGVIYVSKLDGYGDPYEYETTEKGKLFLEQNFKEDEIIDFIKTMSNPDFLLLLTKAYIDKNKK